MLGKEKASEYLLRCSNDPDALNKPLATIQFLLEKMHANVNVVDKDDGKSHVL